MSKIQIGSINATNMQVGDGNTMHVQTQQILQQWYKEIDAKDATPEQKEEAKSLLQRVAEHPLTSALFGAAATAAFEAAKRG